jgi:hypothetical protein
VAGVRRGDKVHGPAISKVDQHLVALARRNQQAPNLHGLGEQPAIAGDDEERPPVGEAQIEDASVRRIQQAQAHDACGYARFRSDSSVHKQRIEGLKAAAAKVLSSTWQRCRVHFMRNALAHVGPSQRPMVAAAIRTAFTQETAEAAHEEWRAVADRLRDRFRKFAELVDEAEDDVLAHMAFPKHHWRQLHSTNPLERLNGEIKRRTDVVAIFPN